MNLECLKKGSMVAPEELGWWWWWWWGRGVVGRDGVREVHMGQRVLEILVRCLWFFSGCCGKQGSDKFDLDSGAEVNLGRPAGMHSSFGLRFR